MADGPELIELVGHVILHAQILAGDVPTAPVLRAQGDAPGGDQRGHLLADDGRGLVERFALQRDVVDVDVRVEHAVAPVERALDVHEPRTRARADDDQHEQHGGGQHADHAAADGLRPAGAGLLAQRFTLFRRGLGARLRGGALRLLPFFCGLRRGAGRGGLLFRRGLPASAGGCARGVVRGDEPVRLLISGDHDFARRFLLRLLCGSLRPPSAAGLILLRHPVTSFFHASKRGACPAFIYKVSAYIILHFPPGCKSYLPCGARPALSLPYIDGGGGAFLSQECAQGPKLFASRVLTFFPRLAIMYPLLLKAANCISGSAGIGRQARLRGVCCMTYGFKSHLPHQTGNWDGSSFPFFHVLRAFSF